VQYYDKTKNQLSPLTGIGHSKKHKMNRRFLANLNRRPTMISENELTSSTSDRRGSTQVVCQRCKRFEVDLTNASDSLSATDAELKASRQVISLLQRQLELFQVEKEGLEKLIISQSKDYTSATTNESPTKIPDNGKPDKEVSSKTDQLGNDQIGLETGENQSPQEDIQKRLLKLIQTQLYSKDQEIVSLKFNLKEAQNEKERLNVQVHLLEDDLSKLKLENSLLRENLALRDQTIVSLSNEVFEQTGNDLSGTSNKHNRRQSSAETFLNQTANHFRQANNDQHYQRQIFKLSDTLEAYKKTNELLSQNVLKLTDKCSLIERREMEAKSQAQELEARCCQIQSKLLSLLKEIEQSTIKQAATTSDTDTSQSQSNEFIHSEPVKLLIKRLLEDKSLDIPLSWKEGNKSGSKNATESGHSRGELLCDELGFYVVANSDTSNLAEASMPSQSSPISSIVQRTRKAKLLNRELSGSGAQLGPVNEANETSDNFNQQSVDSIKNDEADWRLSWDEFIKDFDKINLAKSKEFKNLLRSGVPQEYRCKVWKALIDFRIGKERRNYGSDYYQSLLEAPNVRSSNNCPRQKINPSSKQIELDLLRTLPNNKYFETVDSPGTVRLKRVLNAFAAHKPEVGYCQGMNRLAAVALLVLPEEEAFWCLVSIVEKIMPFGYYNDLWLAQVDSNVVMDFVGALMPNLAEHFRRHEIELSLFAWFLTIFVDGTPPTLFLRLWDCFLYEGDKVMFRIALALLKMNEDILLTLNSSVAVNNLLRCSVNGSLDIDSIFKVAFDSINPLPGSKVRARRESHFQTMKANMREQGLLDKTSLATSEHGASKADSTSDDNNGEHLGEESGVMSV
jgi:hypothetical protein